MEPDEETVRHVGVVVVRHVQPVLPAQGFVGALDEPGLHLLFLAVLLLGEGIVLEENGRTLLLRVRRLFLRVRPLLRVGRLLGNRQFRRRVESLVFRLRFEGLAGTRRHRQLLGDRVGHRRQLCGHGLDLLALLALHLDLDVGAGVQLGERGREDLAISHRRELHRAGRAEFHDAVAFLQARRGRGAVRIDVADHHAHGRVIAQRQDAEEGVHVGGRGAE